MLTRPDLEVQAAPGGPVLAVLVLVGLGGAVPVLAARVDLAGLMAPVDRPLPGLVVLAVPVVPGLVAPAVLALGVRVDPVDRVGLMVPVAQVDRLDLHRMARAVPAALVVLDQVARVDLTDRTGLEALVGPVVLGRLVARMAPAGLVVLMVLEDLNTADPAALMARAGPVVLVGLVAPVGLNTAGLVAPAGRHRGRMCHRVTMTVPARSGVVRGTPRTASALRVTARHPLRLRTVSDGTAGLLPERRRPTGTVHRLPAVGTVRRPPEAGTNTGTGRHTISVGDRRTTVRSTTTDTTPRRSSTRCSVAGASGSSVPGFRCTDLTPA